MTDGRSLDARRKFAAEASGGDSSSVIHDRFEKLAADLKLQGDLLDFGAGKGLLSERLLHSGLFSSITGVDIMSRPSHFPEHLKWISSDLNEPIVSPASSFDVIFAAEVIEHLENPRALAREWFRLLRPHGSLILSTPNNESYRSLLSLAVQGHYAFFGPASYPAHITPLLRKDIHRSLIETGFHPPRFAFSGHGMIPKLSLRWQSISGGLLNGLRYSDNLFAITSK